MSPMNLTYPDKRKRSQVGFTLTELIVVVAIIGLMLGLASLSVSSMVERNRSNEALEVMRNGLDLARQAATTRGTYSYLAFGDDAEGGLYVATIISLHGQAASGDINVATDPDFRYLSPLRYIPQTHVEDVATFTASKVDPTIFGLIPSTSLLNSAQSPASSSSVLRFNVSQTSGTSIWLPRVIEFNPRGFAQIPGQGVATAIWLTIMPSTTNGPTNEQFNKATLLWIHAATGYVETYN